MNKNLKALLKGYVLFDVNGKRFKRYEDARAERVATTERGEAVAFKGFNVFQMRWFYFFVSVYPRPACEVLANPNFKMATMTKATVNGVTTYES